MLLLDFFPYPARYQFLNYLRFFLKETGHVTYHMTY